MMTTSPQTKQGDDKGKDDAGKQERRERRASITKHVMHILGRPVDLQAVQVRRLWDDHYRVNVFIGPNAASVRVAHSFFLQTDAQGNVIASTPQIERQYQLQAETVGAIGSPAH